MYHQVCKLHTVHTNREFLAHHALTIIWKKEKLKQKMTNIITKIIGTNANKSNDRKNAEKCWASMFTAVPEVNQKLS